MPDLPDPKGPRKGVDPWRVERMVQRVPGHIGEESAISPWLLIGAIVGIILVGCALLFFSGAGGFGPAAAAQTSTRPARATEIVAPSLTPQPVATFTPTPPPTPATVKYTVKKGDTLSTIAQKYNVTVQAIRSANNLTGDTIREGDVLIIPLPTPTAPAPPRGTPTPVALATPTLIAFRPSATPAVPLSPTPTPGVILYTVKSGDTLINIAQYYSTTVKAIQDASGLSGPDIRAGQTISIPVGSWQPTATVVVQKVPSATATVEYPYPAPLLNWPPNGKEFAPGESVQLSWLTAGSLKEGEQYVVNVHYDCGETPNTLPIPPVGQGTFYALPDKPACSQGGALRFSWYVVVVRQGGCPGRPASNLPCAISPVSETRTFIWN